MPTAEREAELLAWLEADDASPPPAPPARPPVCCVAQGDVEKEAAAALPKDPPRPKDPPAECARCGCTGAELHRDCPGDMVCRQCWEAYYKGSRPWEITEDYWEGCAEQQPKSLGTRTTAAVTRRVEVRPADDGGVRTFVHYDVSERVEEVAPPYAAQQPQQAQPPQEPPSGSSDAAGAAELLRLRGNHLFSSGELGAALRVYDEAIAVAPEDGAYMLHGNRAQVLMELRRHSEAEEAARAAIRTAPGDWWKGHLRLAYALFHRGAYAEVQEALKEALRRGAPGGPVADVQRAAEQAAAEDAAAARAAAATADDGAAVSAVALRFDPAKGRYGAAARDFAPGEVVFEEAPLCSARLGDFASLAADYAQCGASAREAAAALYCPLDDPKMPQSDRDGLRAAAARLWDRLGAPEQAAFPTEQEGLARLMGICNCNALGRAELGVCCLYRTACRLEHSCAPNLAYYVGDDRSVRFVALRPIAKGDPLSFEYLSGYASREERRATLREKYYFDCGCSACTGRDEAGAFDCTHCPGRVAPSEWVCCSCGRAAATEDVTSYRLLERLAQQQLGKGAVPDVLVMRSERFAVCHWAVRDAARRHARRLAETGRWEEAEERLGRVAEAEGIFYPPAHPARAATFELLGQVVAEQSGRRGDAAAHYATAQALLAAAYGAQSGPATLLRRCVQEVPGARAFGALAAQSRAGQQAPTAP